MRRGLIISLILHAAVLLAALVVLPNPDAFKVAPQQTVMVDISKIGDVAKMKAQAPKTETKVEKPAPAPEPPKPKTDPQPKVAEKEVKAAHEPPPAAEPEPPKKEPPKPEEPKPLDSDPLKNLIKKTEDKPKPPEKPVEKKVADKQPDKKKPKLNPGEIQDLLNKINDKSAAPQPSADTSGKPAEGDRPTEGNDNEMVATLIDLLASKLNECWDKPPGSEESNVHVIVHFSLSPDGMVDGQPQVTNTSDHPLFPAMARAAVNAVYACQPFNFLPKEQYKLWQDNDFDFDPKQKTGT